MKIPEEIQAFIKGKTASVATASADGTPNTTPKGSVRVLDDEHLVFADLFSRKTKANLLANPRIAVAVIDESTYRGYQIKGTAEMLESGPVFDEIVEELKQSPKELPPVQCVVRITVESIYNQSPGREAGRHID